MSLKMCSRNSNDGIAPRFRGVRWAGPKLAIAFVTVPLVLIATACSSGSPSSTAGSSSPSSVSTAGTASKALPSDAGRVLGSCTAVSCTVYKSIPWASLKGKTFGNLQVVAVEGVERWTNVLQSCIQSHGGKVVNVNLQGNVTNAPGVISGWLSQHYAGIFDIGTDLDYSSLLAQAQSQKVPVITWAGQSSSPDLTEINDDQVKGGQEMAQYLVKQLGTKFSVVIEGNSTNKALERRVQGVQAVFAQYPGIKVQVVQVANLTSAGSFQATGPVLQANPNVQAIVGADGDLAVGIAQAVTAAKSKAIVTGFDGNQADYNAVRSGGPYKMVVAAANEIGGQLACETMAVRLAGGKAPAAEMLLEPIPVYANDLPPKGQYLKTAREVTVDLNPAAG